MAPTLSRFERLSRYMAKGESPRVPGGSGVCKRLKMKTSLFGIALMLMTAAWLPASEHHGFVKFAGLPVPGVTVTAIQGDKKLVAVTDETGAYSFKNLPDGTWNFKVEMQTFAPIDREVAVAPNAPSPEWELKLQSL